MIESIGRLNNWTNSCEDIVNKQIALEYWASLQYHAIATYFDKDCVGLKNIYKFFNKCSLEERDHANILMEYQNKRGGVVQLSDITNIDNNVIDQNNEKTDVLQAFEKALEMEQTVYQSLLNVHKVGEESNDSQFTDFIEGTYLEEQIDAINELSIYIAQLKRIGNNGHGIWNFNREFSNE